LASAPPTHPRSASGDRVANILERRTTAACPNISYGLDVLRVVLVGDGQLTNGSPRGVLFVSLLAPWKSAAVPFLLRPDDLGVDLLAAEPSCGSLHDADVVCRLTSRSVVL
jgi:hypothetical protein